MKNIPLKFEKTLAWMIYGSLMILVIGLLSSTSLLSVSHILIVIPIFYFIARTDYRQFPKSAWMLLAMAIIINLSTLFNQDIAVNGLKPILKAKYFYIGFLSIAPYAWFFNKYPKKTLIRYLLLALIFASSLATLSGLIGMSSGVNPLTLRHVDVDRNSGFFGMIMNYAHNLSYLLIILTGLLLYFKKVRDILDWKWLAFAVIFNFVGLYTSYTRGALLAFLAGLPLFIFKNNLKKFFIAGIIVSILFGAFYLAAGNLFVRPGSDSKRLNQWRATVYAFKERPLLGYGFLNFEPLSPEIKKRYGVGDTRYKGHAHSNLFEMLGSTGLLGLTAFLLWVGFWFKEMYSRDDLIAKIALPFIGVFFVGGLTQSTVTLGINLFFVMNVYAISQIDPKILKN